MDYSKTMDERYKHSLYIKQDKLKVDERKRQEEIFQELKMAKSVLQAQVCEQKQEYVERENKVNEARSMLKLEAREQTSREKEDKRRDFLEFTQATKKREEKIMQSFKKHEEFEKHTNAMGEWKQAQVKNKKALKELSLLKRLLRG